MNYLSITKNNVIISNQSIKADGFSCIFLKNIGTDTVHINDNIPLAVGSSYSIDNHPYVVIDENTDIHFDGIDPNKKLLVVKTYFKSV